MPATPATNFAPSRPAGRAETLAALADALQALAEEPEAPTYAIGVCSADGEPDGAEIELVVRPVPTHPLDALLGFSAPDDWWAFGLTARAQAFPQATQDDGEFASAPQPVGVVHLVDRSGTNHGRVLRAGEDPMVVTDPVGGMLADLCCRVLGAPTSPPTVTPAHYMAQSWLAAVLARAAEDPAPLTWPAVAVTHPLFTPGADIAARLAERSDDAHGAADALAATGALLNTTDRWEDLRQAWSGHDDGHAGLDADELTWMDAGMLSRWCCGLYADLEDLVDACAAVLTPPVARSVFDTLARWDIHTTPVPWN